MDDFLRTSGREERQQEQWFILKLKADIKEQEPKQTKKSNRKYAPHIYLWLTVKSGTVNLRSQQ